MTNKGIVSVCTLAVAFLVITLVCGKDIAQAGKKQNIIQTIMQTITQTNEIVKGVANTPQLMYGQHQIKQTASTTFPIVIDQPGSYVLTSNLTVLGTDVNAITINADNVTLDLNGHTITGPPSTTGNGIYAFNRYNIIVKNGVVRDLYYGVYVENDDSNPGGGHRIEGIQASNSVVHGIKADYSTVTNCTASYNKDSGIVVKHSTVRNCAAYNNDGGGIVADYSTVANCTASNNSGNGITGRDGTVTNCTASYNGGYCGIFTARNTVTNCTASNNNGYGIYAYDGTVTNCTVSNNSDDGIHAIWNTVTNCTTNDNDADGIYASKSIVKGCQTMWNTGYGIIMSPDSYNYIYRNRAGNNSAGQINCPSGNTCLSNAEF